MGYIKEITNNDSEYIKQLVKFRYLMQFEELDADPPQLIKDEAVLMTNNETYIYEHLNKDLFINAYIIDDKVVSMSSLIVTYNFPERNYLNGKKGFISFVYTDKAYRKQGLQKQVFESIIAKARKLDISILKLFSNNPVAAEMYKSFGFVEIENGYKYKL